MTQSRNHKLKDDDVNENAIMGSYSCDHVITSRGWENDQMTVKDC